MARFETQTLYNPVSNFLIVSMGAWSVTFVNISLFLQYHIQTAI